MDRIDAIKAFLAAIDEGSLSGAARRLNRSPAAITRTIDFLESEVGVELLHRTTRVLRLSDAGERYAIACRQILADLE
ncbi:MAG TPA: LysR family transcriptional regulator, partial [Rhodopila sp.]|nr:LysR family transcriptional regulator [Rhodopila sp.]